MYIEPNSSFYILSGCPLNNNYEHTVLFSDKTAQYNYFNSLAKHRLNKQSYQRYTDNTMRVQVKAEDLYDCDYLMFKNTSFGDKWFYAFILSVTYVNNVTSEILYEIDVMQTWHFDYQLLPCFVEREHSATDAIGENTIPENLEIGPYVTTATSAEVIGDYYVWVIATEVPESVATYFIGPAVYNGYPNPCYACRVGSISGGNTTMALVKTITDAYADGKSDAIVAIFAVPTNFVVSSEQMSSTRKTILGANRVLSATPRNNKLYTYPYCVNVSICGGEAMELRYELFNGQPTFEAIATFGVNSAVPVVARNYAGEAYSYANTVTIKDFPILPWVREYYQNWIAQNRSQLTVSIASSAAKGVLQVAKEATRPLTPLMSGYMSGSYTNASKNAKLLNVTEAAVDTALSIAGTLAKIEDAKVIPDSLVGSVSGNDALAFAGAKGFYNYCRSIRPEYIRIVDDYFTMYGYATHRVKAPNRSARPRWNYVKTVGCLISGTVPADTGDAIKSVYDSGVTFWKNPSEIGNYTLDNSV